MSETELRYNPPKQSRSQRTLERIEQAALALIAEVGVEQATIQDIVKRARSSVGSFYARFAGKEDLLLHLEEMVWARARDRFDQALEERDLSGVSLTGILEPLVRLVLDSHREDRRKRTSLDLRPGGHEQGTGMRGFHAHILARVRPLILERRDEIGHAIPERAVEVGFAAVVGAIQVLEEGTLEEGARAGLTDETVVAELSRMYRSYLGGGRVEGEAPPQMEFFDIWE
jgi:AcrR family transcriptional regulator